MIQPLSYCVPSENYVFCVAKSKPEKMCPISQMLCICFKHGTLHVIGSPASQMDSGGIAAVWLLYYTEWCVSVSHDSVIFANQIPVARTRIWSWWLYDNTFNLEDKKTHHFRDVIERAISKKFWTRCYTLCMCYAPK